MDRWGAEQALGHGRLSGGYTLDEAARLYRSRMSDRGLVCPGCGVAMSDITSARPAGGVSLVRCTRCGRGLVLEFRTVNGND